MNIKIKEITQGCMPEIIKVGDWVDLMTAEDYSFKCPHAKMLHKHKGEKGSPIERSRDVVFDYKLLNLGVAVQLPRGFEVVLLPRSSTFKKWGILLVNSQGVIDQSYCGPNDIWRFPALATRTVTIPKGTPIAQFRIQLSQKASVWQKLRWLFSSRIKLVKVNEMNSADRGGLGTGSDKYRTSKSSQDQALFSTSTLTTLTTPTTSASKIKA